LIALVDDEDADLAQINWCKSNGYAQASHGVLMHRIILERKIGRPLKGRREFVDHINGNRADNRRVNLRISNNSQNQANRGPSSRSSTGYKGVYLDKHAVKKNCKKPYKAMIRVKGKAINIGTYATPKEAAHAYDQAATRHFGEYAQTNF
jgi:hypothetical protein